MRSSRQSSLYTATVLLGRLGRAGRKVEQFRNSWPRGEKFWNRFQEMRADFKALLLASAWTRVLCRVERFSTRTLGVCCRVSPL